MTKNNSGFVLITAIVFLAILSIIGITGISASNTDLRIAGNDLRHKQVFYQADGGTQVAMEMIEQAFACNGNLPDSLTIGSDTEPGGYAQVRIINPDFTRPDPDTSTNDLEITAGNGLFITWITISGTLVPQPSGKDHILYEILSVCQDAKKNAAARVRVRYRHVAGQNISCPYQNGAIPGNDSDPLRSGMISWEIPE